MIPLLKLLAQPFVLRHRHRKAGLRIGLFSVCDDVRFGLLNTIHNFVRLRDVSLGDLTYVANGATIVNARIGKFSSIGPECRIGLGTHPIDMISTHPAFYSIAQRADRSFATREIVESRSVSIGSDVWIGARAMIMDGVTIGDGAVIGAGAVVTRDIEPYSIAAGIPAKVLRRRFDAATVAALLESRWWDRDIEWIRANALAFADVRRFIDDNAN
jgi:acetyltransferase-like isoleucine patch superfamily enzyme